MSNGFERRKEQSKEEIRRAAGELFGQFGVEKVSMADIARRAGVSQATIYNNFGNKEALAREFVAVVIERMVSRAREVLAPDRPYWEKVSAFIAFISQSMADGRPFELERSALSGSLDLLDDPEVRKIRAAAQEEMAALLLELVQEGKAQGQIQAGLSEEAVRIYLTAFMDIFADPRLQQRYNTRPALVQDLAALMIFGLSGKGPA
jgi:AcrR family transcriptional regulator